jgi:hypothetical protein
MRLKNLLRIELMAFYGSDVSYTRPSPNIFMFMKRHKHIYTVGWVRGVKSCSCLNRKRKESFGTEPFFGLTSTLTVFFV